MNGNKKMSDENGNYQCERETSRSKTGYSHCTENFRLPQELVSDFTTPFNKPNKKKNNTIKVQQYEEISNKNYDTIVDITQLKNKQTPLLVVGFLYGEIFITDRKFIYRMNKQEYSIQNVIFGDYVIFDAYNKVQRIHASDVLPLKTDLDQVDVFDIIMETTQKDIIINNDTYFCQLEPIDETQSSQDSTHVMTNMILYSPIKVMKLTVCIDCENKNTIKNLHNNYIDIIPGQTRTLVCRHKENITLRRSL